jgi:hypothetical protein
MGPMSICQISFVALTRRFPLQYDSIAESAICDWVKLTVQIQQYYKISSGRFFLKSLKTNKFVDLGIDNGLRAEDTCGLTVFWYIFHHTASNLNSKIETHLQLDSLQAASCTYTCGYQDQICNTFLQTNFMCY